MVGGEVALNEGWMAGSFTSESATLLLRGFLREWPIFKISLESSISVEMLLVLVKWLVKNTSISSEPEPRGDEAHVQVSYA